MHPQKLALVPIQVLLGRTAAREQDVVVVVVVPDDDPEECPGDDTKGLEVSGLPFSQSPQRIMMVQLTPEHIKDLCWKEKLTSETARYTVSAKSKSWLITWMEKPLTFTSRKSPLTNQVTGTCIDFLRNCLIIVFPSIIDNK